MTEQALQDFLENRIDVQVLADDLKGSQRSTGATSTEVFVKELDDADDFEITAEHLVRLCDQVIAGRLRLIDLSTIAFALHFSVHFDWDGQTEIGQRVSEALFAWDNPEIDYDLTTENVKKWKHYLATGERLFDPNELKRKK